MLSFIKWIRSWCLYLYNFRKFSRLLALSIEDFPTLSESNHNELEWAEKLELFCKKEFMLSTSLNEYPVSISKKAYEHLGQLFSQAKSMLDSSDGVDFYYMRRFQSFSMSVLCKYDPQRRFVDRKGNFLYIMEKLVEESEASAEFDAQQTIKKLIELNDAVYRSYKLFFLKQDTNEFNKKQDTYDLESHLKRSFDRYEARLAALV